MNELTGTSEVVTDKEFEARGTELVTDAMTWQSLLHAVSQKIANEVGQHNMTHFEADVTTLSGEEHYEWEAKGEIL